MATSVRTICWDWPITLAEDGAVVRQGPRDIDGRYPDTNGMRGCPRQQQFQGVGWKPVASKLGYRAMPRN